MYNSVAHLGKTINSLYLTNNSSVLHPLPWDLVPTVPTHRTITYTHEAVHSMLQPDNDHVWTHERGQNNWISITHTRRYKVLTSRRELASSWEQTSRAAGGHQRTMTPPTRSSSSRGTQTQPPAVRRPCPPASRNASAPPSHPPAIPRQPPVKHWLAGRCWEAFLTWTPNGWLTRRESSTSSHLTKVTTSSMSTNAAPCTSLIRNRMKSPCLSTSDLIWNSQNHQFSSQFFGSQNVAVQQHKRTCDFKFLLRSKRTWREATVKWAWLQRLAGLQRLRPDKATAFLFEKVAIPDSGSTHLLLHSSRSQNWPFCFELRYGRIFYA